MKNQPLQTPPGRALPWIRLLLVAATLLAFWHVVTADFTNWDDPQTTYANPHLLPPTPANIAWFWSHAYMDIYAPIPFSLWGGLLSISKLPVPDENGVAFNPWIFHAANLLLHVGAVLAAFELLRRLVRHNGAAAVGALFFALHPVQVEPVAWISGAKDLLYGLFSLIALWQYVEYVHCSQEASDKTATHAGGSKPRVHYVIALLALLLALFSKPTAVVTPLLAFVIDWLLLRRSWRKSLAALWPWFALAAPFAIIAKFAQPAMQVNWPLWLRPLVAADALAFYLYKLVYPIHLAVDYGRNPGWLMRSDMKYWTWIVPLVVAVGIWLLSKRERRWAAGGLILLIGVLPVLGLSPFDFQLYSTVADHYLYLAMIGPALAAAALLARWWRPVNITVGCVVLVALGVGASRQIRYWQNTLTLFHHALAVNPISGLSHQNIGTYYIQLGVSQSDRAGILRNYERITRRQGRIAEADGAADEARQLVADARQSFMNGKEQTEMALKVYPTWPSLNINLAEVLADLGEYDQAMAQLRAVDGMKDSYPLRVRRSYGSRWFTDGMAAYARGEDRQAMKYFGQGALSHPMDLLSNHALRILSRKMDRARAAADATSRP